MTHKIRCLAVVSDPSNFIELNKPNSVVIAIVKIFGSGDPPPWWGGIDHAG